MRLLFTLMCGLFAFPFGVAAPALKEKPQTPPLLGEWQRVGHLQAGENRFSQGENHRQMFKADGAWEYAYNKNVTKGYTFITDLTKKPPTVDIRLNNMGTAGWHGVYKIEGDTLTLCLVEIGKDCPQSFESSAEKPTTIWVFNRVKPAD